MKRILFIIAALNAGGAERVIVTLANELSKENNVTLLKYDDDNSFYKVSERVKIRGLGVSLPKDGICRKLLIPFVELQRYCGIRKVIMSTDWDAVISFCNTANFLTALVAFFHRNVPIYVSERADPFQYAGWSKWSCSHLYRYCKGIICQNKVAQGYYEKFGWKNRLLILDNPVSFDDIPCKRVGTRNPIITNVGRLTALKNQRLLIDAFAELSDDFPDYQLHIYGEGPLRRELEKQIHDMHLEGRVFLMGTKANVIYEIAKGSFFVLCSNSEGFPNVLVEAMAAFQPVISTDFNTGIARRLIEDGENGYLVSVGDKDELVYAMKKMIMRADEYDVIGDRNRTIAMEYRADVVAMRWLEELTK